MEMLLSFLKTTPEYNELLAGISRGDCCAVTGIGQINRSHLIAGLHKDLDNCLVLICQDDATAKRLQEELQSFLKEPILVLPTRDLTLYNTAAVSREWEQKRLRQLYTLAEKKTKILTNGGKCPQKIKKRNGKWKKMAILKSFCMLDITLTNSADIY